MDFGNISILEVNVFIICVHETDPLELDKVYGVYI